jgi:hypothetical protein
MYQAGLGIQVIGEFSDHKGFDGLMLGWPNGCFHLEFTYCRSHPISPKPTPEDLMVLYIPELNEWHAACASMKEAGFSAVTPFNPYWESSGATFEDHDGYQTVLQCAKWENTLAFETDA